jgi:glutathione peroxidase
LKEPSYSFSGSYWYEAEDAMKLTVMIYVLTMVMIFISLTAGTKKKESKDEMATPAVYEFSMKTIDGKERSLSDYRGKVLMIVNVASFCGYTPQYSDLETLYERYKSKGFAIAAFPANNFGSQEPGTNDEIKEFCSINYSISFDLYSKISVKGDDQNPLYRYLTKETLFKGDVAWNFTKYLVDKEGNVVAKFSSKVNPTSPEVTKKIEELL